MLDYKYLKSVIGEDILQRGERLYKRGHVGELSIMEDPNSGFITIDTTVKSSHFRSDYDVHILLSPNSKWVMDYDCTCPYFDTYIRPCKHIAAVLLKYMDEMSFSEIGNGKARPKRNTDPAIMDLIQDYQNDQPLITEVSSQPVRIEPYINGYGNTQESMSVEFKIGICGQHMYIIQNISNFCSMIENHERKKYGKQLDFVHERNAFEPACRPLIDFLVSLYHSDDSYSSNSYSYYSYSCYSSGSELKRTLSLKGRYLDDFINACNGLPIHVMESDGYSQIDTLFTLSDDTPSIHMDLNRTDNGYTLKNNTHFYLFTGNQYLYYLDMNKKEILRIKNNNTVLPLLKYLKDSGQDSLFISEKDMPSFSRYLWPVISAYTDVKADNFNPVQYIPPKPSFEVYLDLPQKDLITGELYAVYPDKKYSVLDNTNTDNGHRDLEEEQAMDRYMTSWFTSFDPVTHMLALSGDQDKTYQFLKNGIPALQDKATVYISDRLKKIALKPMPKVSVGVSVSHDILQLDLVSDDIDLKQIAEILSRYDRKKKYYRLKNGQYIEADDSLDELAQLKESLSLKNSDITSGKAELPKYRAMYLDDMADEGAFDIDRDTSFRRMIQHMHDTDGSVYDVPSDLNAVMRPYQIDGFRWLCSLRDNGLGGLLADEMGLGKTLEVIAFIGSWKDRQRTLIVCPASLVYNWYSEIHKFMPSLKSVMIQGTAEMRKELIQSSGENDILITSYDLLKRDTDFYKGITFSCEVIDEAQYIKNASTQAAKAVKDISSVFRIALTGTPIENRLSELWSIFDYLMPGFFHSYQYFREHYELPIVRDEDDLTEKDLTRMITPFVLRRLKKDVLKDLPDKLEEVYYAPLEGEQKELYEARVQRLKLLLNKQSDQEFRENKIVVLAELTRLRQICCDPGLVYEKYKGNSSKEDLCIDMIRNAVEAGHKVLLFSQFTTMLDELTARLDKEKIRYYLLEGATPKKKRAEMTESFQSDDVPVFCISLKAGGTGLNLTAADIVIHYDPWWNTAVENQATDRAHRIGQKNVVSVYRLIMKDTVEERILALQEEKSDLAGRVLSGEGISSSKLTREDLLQLL
ncbi:MAG: SNF2 helicase associated domain-containing protein [Erysipelotrichaceae bacterium]|nr:SNF2 helicase associated domain-containing protein [Erysipelotrichaceae bacterium]